MSESLTPKLPRYTSLGCYPLFYVPQYAGGYVCLCASCADAADDTSPDNLVGSVNWEDPDLRCDECGDRIESAYAEDEAASERCVCRGHGAPPKIHNPSCGFKSREAAE